MAWIEAFAPAEARYSAAVMGATWGHLAPEKNHTYHGYIVYAVGCFGNDPLNPTPLACEFEDLDSSPWFFDALNDFIGDRRRNNKEGCVYRFDGSFRNYVFRGRITKVFDPSGR